MFIPLISTLGIARFALTLSNSPGLAHYTSMTSIILIAIIFYGFQQTTYRERFLISYALIGPYVFIESAGLGYSWYSGNETIFHVWPYSLGTTVSVHFWGHIIGGFTWEPLLVFGLISALARLLMMFKSTPTGRGC